MASPSIPRGGPDRKSFLSHKQSESYCSCSKGLDGGSQLQQLKFTTTTTTTHLSSGFGKHRDWFNMPVVLGGKCICPTDYILYDFSVIQSLFIEQLTGRHSSRPRDRIVNKTIRSMSKFHPCRVTLYQEIASVFRQRARLQTQDCCIVIKTFQQVFFSDLTRISLFLPPPLLHPSLRHHHKFSGPLLQP